MGKMEIALLAGGWSTERDVSIRSGDAVSKALDKRKYTVTRYDPRDDLVSLLEDKERIDLAIIMLHGKQGEDGCLQGFLDILGLPFMGSGTLASALAFNKEIAKIIFREAGLQVIQDIMLQREGEFSLDRVIEAVGPSAVVKPVAEGSSIGISICHGKGALRAGIDRAFQFDRDIMVERYIRGREVTCCVIGGRMLEALPIIEIVPGDGYEFFDYEAKYTAGATREICPAPISEEMGERIRYCAKQAHRALKCSAWSRTDMMIDDENVYILETNTLPGMTETSLVPLAAKAAGMSLSQLLDRLITLSLEPGASG